MITSTLTVTYRHGKIARTHAGYGVSVTPEPLSDQGRSYQIGALRLPYGMKWGKGTDIVSVLNLPEKSVRIPAGILKTGGIDADTDKEESSSSRLGCVLLLKGGTLTSTSPSLEVQQRLKVRGGEVVFLRARFPGTAIRYFFLETKPLHGKKISSTWFEVEESETHLGGYTIRGGWGDKHWEHKRSNAII